MTGRAARRPTAFLSVDVEVVQVKAITLRPSWAWAVAFGGKRVENRSWYSAHRGALLIHAGIGRDPDADVVRFIARRRGIVAPAEFAQGVIVARVELHDVMPIDDAAIDADQYAYATGPYLWLLRDVVPVKPIKLRGRQGLFDAGDLRVRAL